MVEEEVDDILLDHEALVHQVEGVDNQEPTYPMHEDEHGNDMHDEQVQSMMVIRMLEVLEEEVLEVLEVRY